MAWAIIDYPSDAYYKKRGVYLGKYCGFERVPDYMMGHTHMLFETRSKARAWIKMNYGYLKTRPDLTGPPHNWKMPQPVQVEQVLKRVTP